MFNDDKLENWFFFKSKLLDPAERLLDLSKAFEIFIKTQKPDIIFIEESFYSNNFKTSRAITEVIGNCKLVAKINDVPYETVAVRSWKKYVLGNGKADKAAIKKFILAKYPKLEGEPQDIFDATGIALWGILENGKE
jgi:Holliday junction resolvasome RuvABC endonuclease subunit